MKTATGELVLLYGFTDEERIRKIRSAVLLLGARSKIITEEDYGKPVGLMAGMQTGSFDEESGNIDDEMIVLYRFSGKRIDELLRRLKKAGSGSIARKAVLTETNMAWSGYRLFQELTAEHEAMQQGKTAHNPQ